jgi:hypothetical protein
MTDVYTQANLANFESYVIQIDVDASGNVTPYVNGVAVALDGGSPTSVSRVLLNGDGMVGAEYDISLGGVTTNFLEGNVGEILVYERNLSDNERADLTAYLKEKWGIS